MVIHSQLRTGAVEDNGVETKTVQERERESEVVELVGENGTTDPAWFVSGWGVESANQR